MTSIEHAARQEATRVLTRVPEYVWDGESLPIPVERIVDSCYGLLVREVEDLSAAPGAPRPRAGQSLSGLLLADAGEIWVSAGEAKQWPPRRRFTIGHELGHWVMHAADGETIFCRAPMVAPEDPEVPDPRPPLPPEEFAANAFAAELLMPEHAMRVMYERKHGDFWALRKCFDVSAAALERRLGKLGLEVLAP